MEVTDMNVKITVRYQKPEDISQCLETVSKAVSEWEEKYSSLCTYEDEVQLNIEPLDKSDIQSSMPTDEVIKSLEKRLKACSIVTARPMKREWND